MLLTRAFGTVVPLGQGHAAAHCVTFGQSAAARKARIHVYDEFKSDVQRQGFDQGFRQGHADGDSLLLEA